MDIAATGFALPQLSPIRDRAQARPDNSQQGNVRGRGNGARNPADTAGRNERVVDGEVIYVRPEQPRALDRLQNSPADGMAFNTSGFRRFSMQAALQTFRENEALLTEPGQSRQVSGIIDEYV